MVHKFLWWDLEISFVILLPEHENPKMKGRLLSFLHAFIPFVFHFVHSLYLASLSLYFSIFLSCIFSFLSLPSIKQFLMCFLQTFITFIPLMLKQFIISFSCSCISVLPLFPSFLLHSFPISFIYPSYCSSCPRTVTTAKEGSSFHLTLAAAYWVFFKYDRIWLRHLLFCE